MRPPLSSIIIDPQLTDAKAAELLKQELDSAVEKNDTQKVQRILDDAFYSEYRIRPEWKHLKTAALNGNDALARLLVSWGATGTKSEIADIALQHSDRAIIAFNVLKGCGLFHDLIPEKTFAADKNVHPVETTDVKLKVINQAANEVIDPEVAKLPKEWLTVLKTIQNLGSPEAIIAGGALRDTFNQRAVRDVDIFLANPFSGFFQKSKQQAFLENIFKTAGLEIHDHIMSYSYGRMSKFPKPTKNKIVTRDYELVFISPTTSWRVIAGPKKTEYNIVFVEKTLGNALKHGNCKDLLYAFDIGICQIGTDGKNIFITGYYSGDSITETIEVRNENPCSLEHLQRIIAKYPDYKIGTDAKKILNPPKKNRAPKSWGS